MNNGLGWKICTVRPNVGHLPDIMKSYTLRFVKRALKVTTALELRPFKIEGQFWICLPSKGSSALLFVGAWEKCRSCGIFTCLLHLQKDRKRASFRRFNFPLRGKKVSSYLYIQRSVMILNRSTMIVSKTWCIIVVDLKREPDLTKHFPGIYA